MSNSPPPHLPIKPQNYRPDPVPISAYGDYGFRFDDMSHKGHMMITPLGMYAWHIPYDVDEKGIENLTWDYFMPWLADFQQSDVVLLGMGKHPWHFPTTLRKAFQDHDIFIEVMDSGAAVRSYNVLLQEGRQFSATFIAVER